MNKPLMAIIENRDGEVFISPVADSDVASRAKQESIPADPLAREIVAELEAAHRAEMRRSSDIAFIFLTATNGDFLEAEKIFDNAIDLLCESGVLQLYRYRAVLAAIREGL